MRIVYINNLYGELARGGAERVVEAEAKAMTEAGHAVLVVSAGPKEIITAGVCSPENSAICAPAVTGTIRTLRLHQPNLYFYPEGERHNFLVRFIWHLFDMANWPAARNLRDLLRREKPDVVHTHNLMGIGFLTPRAIKRERIRHVHTVHDVQLLHPSGLLPARGRSLWWSRLAQLVYVIKMRWLMGSPEVVFFPSEFLLDLHVKNGFFPKSRRVVLRNPAAPAGSKERRFPEEPVFLFAGQLEPHKGIRLLIGAWESWPEKNRSSLEIAGAGSLTQEIRKRAGERADVVMHGRLDHEPLSAAFRRASFYVFPSLVIENSPTAIIESLAAGTPVLAAATGGVPELVRDGENGFLFEPGDESGCLAVMKKAAALSAATWQKMSVSARESVRDLAAEKHMKVLSDTYSAGLGK